MTAVAPGWWWVALADGSCRQIVQVTGDFARAEDQTVSLVGLGFCSVAKFKERGFEFLKQVTEEAR